MDKLLGVLGVGAAFLAGYTTAVAFNPNGSDLQLILGALYSLISVICLIGAAVLAHMGSKNTNKELAR